MPYDGCMCENKKIVIINFGLNQNKTQHTDESDVLGLADLPFVLFPFHGLRDDMSLQSINPHG